VDLPIIQKSSVYQHVLMNKKTNEYDNGEGYTTSELLRSKKHNGYSRVLYVRDGMDNPSEWEILKVKTTCEIESICD